jgi:hypothetical protein
MFNFDFFVLIWNGFESLCLRVSLGIGVWIVRNTCLMCRKGCVQYLSAPYQLVNSQAKGRSSVSFPVDLFVRLVA